MANFSLPRHVPAKVPYYNGRRSVVQTVQYDDDSSLVPVTYCSDNRLEMLVYSVLFVLLCTKYFVRTRNFSTLKGKLLQGEIRCGKTRLSYEHLHTSLTVCTKRVRATDNLARTFQDVVALQ